MAKKRKFYCHDLQGLLFNEIERKTDDFYEQANQWHDLIEICNGCREYDLQLFLIQISRL